MSPSRFQLPEIQIPERFLRPARWVGYPLFGLVAFLLSLYLSLPRDRIQDQLLAGTSEAIGADIKATGFGLSLLWPGVHLDGVSITARPPPGQPPPLGPDGKPEKPSRWLIDDLTIYFDLIPLMRGQTSTDFRGHAAEGKVAGSYAATLEKLALGVDAERVQLKAIPSLPAAIGLTGVPLEGQLQLKGQVVAPAWMWAQADGEADLTVVDGLLGDGKAKLTVPGNPYLSAGITVPPVKLGKIVGSATITKGRVQLKDVRAHSPDLDVEIEGFIELRDPVAFSQLHLYVKLKPSDALIKRESSLEILVNVAGQQARRPDGYFGIDINGPANAPYVRPSPTPPPGLNVRPPGPPPPGAPPLPPPPRPPVTATPPVVTAPPSLPTSGPPATPAPPPAPPAPEFPTAPPTSAPTLPPPPTLSAPPPSAGPAPAEAMPANAVPPGPRFSGAPLTRTINSAVPSDDARNTESSPEGTRAVE